MSAFMEFLAYGGGAVAFALSFALGANDIGNSWGTAVGSGSLSVRTACIFGGLCEFLGALLLGQPVFKTLRAGVVEPECYSGDWTTLALGFFAASAGSAIFKGFATWRVWPVSSAHAIVGGILGFGVLLHADCLNGTKLLYVVASWVISPLSGGIGGYILYWLVNRIEIARNPYKTVLIALPYIWPATAAVMLYVPLTEIPEYLGFDMPMWLFVTIMGAIMVVTCLASFILVTHKKWEGCLKLDARLNSLMAEAEHSQLEKQLQSAQVPTLHELQERDKSGAEESSDVQLQVGAAEATPVSAVTTAVDSNKSELEVLKAELANKADFIFTPLLVFTAAVLSFSHGANNLANAVGPYDSIMMIYNDGKITDRDTPFWIIALGGGALAIGVVLVGYKIMDTVGRKITTMTKSRGYAVQVASALVLMVATLLGIPVSTTHVVIGAVTGVGIVLSAKNVNSAVLLKIVYSWGITLPFSFGLSLLFYLILDRWTYE